MKSQPFFSWKGKTFSEITSFLTFNRRALDIQIPFSNFLKPLPCVIARKELCYETKLGTKEITFENTCSPTNSTQVNARRRVRASLSSRDVSKTSITENYISTNQNLPTVIYPTSSSAHIQNVKFQSITCLNNNQAQNNSLAYSVSETGYNVKKYIGFSEPCIPFVNSCLTEGPVTSITTFNVRGTSFDISFVKSPGYLNYYDVIISNVYHTFVKETTTNITSFSDLSINTSYSVKVITYYYSSNIYSSESVASTRNESAVNNIQFQEITGNSISLSFTPSVGTPLSYTFKRSSDNIVYSTLVNPANLFSFTFTDLSKNTNYTIDVKTVYPSHNEYNSLSVSQNTNNESAVTNLSIINIETNSATVTFTDSPNIINYTITLTYLDRKITNFFSGNIYTLQNLIINTNYIVTIISSYGSEFEYSNSVPFQTVNESEVQDVRIDADLVTGDSMLLRFTSSLGTNMIYIIYLNDISYNTTSIFYQFTQLTPGTLYNIYVKTFYELTNHTYDSSAIQQTTQNESAVTNLSISNITASSLTVSFTRSANYSSNYIITIYLQSSPVYTIETLFNSWTFSNLIQNASYQIRVNSYYVSRSYNNEIIGRTLNETAVTSPYVARITGNTATISYTASPNTTSPITNYTIQAFRNGSIDFSGNTTGTSYTFDTLSYNVDYSFDIITNYSNSHYLVSIPGRTLNETHVNSLSVARITGNTATISYTASPNTTSPITNYTIRAFRNGSMDFSGNTTGTSYTFDKLTFNTEYSFSVITNYNNNQYYSSTITERTLNEASISTILISETGSSWYFAISNYENISLDASYTVFLKNRTTNNVDFSSNVSIGTTEIRVSYLSSRPSNTLTYDYDFYFVTKYKTTLNEYTESTVNEIYPKNLISTNTVSGTIVTFDRVPNYTGSYTLRLRDLSITYGSALVTNGNSIAITPDLLTNVGPGIYNYFLGTTYSNHTMQTVRTYSDILIPYPISSLTVTGVTTNSMTIQIGPSTSNNISSYVLTARSSSGVVSQSVQTVNAPVVFTELLTSTLYDISGVAINEYGGNSTAVSIQKSTRPNPPTIMVVETFTTDSIAISFTASTTSNVTYTVTAQTGTTVKIPTTVASGIYTFSSLSSGTLYTISSVATNAYNETSIALSRDQSTKPNPPTNMVVGTIATDSIAISFTASTTSNVTYTVTATPVNGGETKSQLTDLTTYRIDGLVSYTLYNISIYARINDINSDILTKLSVATLLDITTTANRSITSTTNGEYTVLQFNSSDTNFSIANFKGSMNILAVGGGGGGGLVYTGNQSQRSGAGGGGGFVEQTSTVSTNAIITGSIQIGAGGTYDYNGGDGEKTIVSLTNVQINAYGGGGGGSGGTLIGRPGGSGGGAASVGSSHAGGDTLDQQGFKGGDSMSYRSGGGGGAGSVGKNGGTGVGNGVTNGPGDGGAGKRPTLHGLPTNTYFAGGGGYYNVGNNSNKGGAARVYANEYATPNTGGGGAWYGNNSKLGGSGVVYIAFPTIPT